MFGRPKVDQISSSLSRHSHSPATAANPMQKHLPTVALVAPFLIFFALPSLISFESFSVNAAGERVTELIPSRYTAMIAARVILMGGVMAWFWRYYLSSFPFRIDLWGVLVGLIGGPLWIGLCHLQLEQGLISLLGFPPELLGSRDGVNPFETYPDATSLGMFLAFRFALLVIAVPIAEELFLRGFFMRVLDAVDWTKLPLTEIGTTGLIAGTLYGMATHPSEFVAAAVWFSLVTWLMVATGKFWNCVVAHAVTNLMLGVYVMATGTWSLW